MGDLTIYVSDYSQQIEVPLSQLIKILTDVYKTIDRLHKQKSDMEGERKIYGLLQMMAHSVAT